jgi:outer membrane protein OmpA-like peptidoglycan-associated protein
MRSLNTLAIAMAVVLGATGLTVAAVGCTGDAQIQLGTPSATPPPPPPPPAAPADTDGDGVADADDKCPDAKEDGKDPNPHDGCPDDDPDKDGIKGAADKCPDQPETFNGYQDEDGCPDTKPMVSLVGHEIKIEKQVMFEEGKAVINMTESGKLLEEIANVMKTNPKLEYIEIAGHTDVHGKEPANKKLAQDRAAAVMAALVTLGVDAGRMRAVGYGQYCLVDPATTPEADAKNRRVQFHVLRNDGKDTDVKWGGCDNATKKGMKPQALPKPKAATTAPAAAPAKATESAKKPASTSTKGKK